MRRRQRERLEREQRKAHAETLADRAQESDRRSNDLSDDNHDNGEQNSNHVRFDKYEFDFEKMLFHVNEQAVELSKTEQKLLRYFIMNRGITLSRDALIDRIWTDGAEYVDENALSVAVKRLRDKLSAHQYIKTVYGVGYVWKKEQQESYD